MTDGAPQPNPYEFGPESTRGSESAPDSQLTPPEALSSDCRENLTLTVRILRIASVLMGLGAIGAILQIWAAFHALGFPSGWTWWHTLIAYRIVYTPACLLLAWMLWKYTTALQKMSLHGATELEAAMEQQAKTSLALGLVIFVMLLGMAIAMSGAISAGPR
jgi:hypothetical protein